MNVRTLSLVALLSIIAAPFALARQEPYVEQAQALELFKTPVVRGAVVSATTPLAAFSSTEKLVEVLDALTLAKKASLVALPNRISALAYSPSGQLLATGIVDGKLMLWNTATGTAAKTLSPHSAGITNLCFGDENIVLTTGIDNSLKVTDLSSGKTLGSLTIDKDEIASATMASGGKMFAIGLGSGQVRIYSVAPFGITATLTDFKDRVGGLAFSPDGKILAAGIIDGQVGFWDMGTKTIRARFAAHKGPVSSISIDPKGRWAVTAGADSTIKLTDLVKFNVVKSLRESEGYVTYTGFANDELLMEGTSKGFVRRWRVLAVPPDTTNPSVVLLAPPAGGLTRVVAKMYDIDGVAYDDTEVKDVMVNGRPAAVTPARPGDAARVPAGFKGKHFTYSLSLDSIGVNPFQVKAVDKFNHNGYQTGYIQRLDPKQAIEVQAPQDNIETDKVSVPIQFRAWLDVASYTLTVNLIDITSGQAPPNKSAGSLISDEVPLVVGYNEIEISVLSKTGEQYKQTVGVNRKLVLQTPPPSVAATTKKERKGAGDQAWAVVVGISQYANPAIPGLQFADKDAEAFANFLRLPAGGGYDADHMRVLLNKDATLANVRDALINFLNQAIDKDLVMIYFAGHGAPEPARPQNVYLLTTDSDPNLLGTTAFPMWTMQDVLGRYISAKRIVVFSDACHSGAISVNFATRGLSATDENLVNQYLTDLSKTHEGTVIFTASAAGEVSQEFPDLGHGVFTYYLLKGMEGEADYNNDYTITINELMQYVEDNVKRKTHGAQNPTRSQTMYDKELTIATRPK